MKVEHVTRSIEQWTSEKVRVEREGTTLTIQVAINNQAQGLIMPVQVAEQLRQLLDKATAIPGIVVRQPDEEPHEEVATV